MLTSYLSDGFFEKLKEIGAQRGFHPEHALAVMLYESGVNPRAIHPSAPASGIFGKIFKTREEALAFAELSAEEQLDAFDRYMAPYTSVPKPRAENLYQLNFLPASAIPGQTHYRGTDDDAVLAAHDGSGYGGQEASFYTANRNLDRDGDGQITVADLRAALEAAQAGQAAKWSELRRRLAMPAPAPSRFPWKPALIAGAVGATFAYVVLFKPELPRALVATFAKAP